MLVERTAPNSDCRAAEDETIASSIMMTDERGGYDQGYSTVQRVDISLSTSASATQGSIDWSLPCW